MKYYNFFVILQLILFNVEVILCGENVVADRVITDCRQTLREAPRSSLTGRLVPSQSTLATPSFCSGHRLIYLRQKLIQIYYDIAAHLKFHICSFFFDLICKKTNLIL